MLDTFSFTNQQSIQTKGRRPPLSRTLCSDCKTSSQRRRKGSVIRPKFKLLLLIYTVSSYGCLELDAERYSSRINVPGLLDDDWRGSMNQCCTERHQTNVKLNVNYLGNSGHKNKDAQIYVRYSCISLCKKKMINQLLKAAISESMKAYLYQIGEKKLKGIILRLSKRRKCNNAKRCYNVKWKGFITSFMHYKT